MLRYATQSTNISNESIKQKHMHHPNEKINM